MDAPIYSIGHYRAADVLSNIGDRSTKPVLGRLLGVPGSGTFACDASHLAPISPMMGWHKHLAHISRANECVQLFYVAETALAFSVGNVAHGLANGGMTDEQRAALSPTDPEYHLRYGNEKTSDLLALFANNM